MVFSTEVRWRSLLPPDAAPISNSSNIVISAGRRSNITPENLIHSRRLPAPAAISIAVSCQPNPSFSLLGRIVSHIVVMNSGNSIPHFMLHVFVSRKQHSTDCRNLRKTASSVPVLGTEKRKRSERCGLLERRGSRNVHQRRQRCDGLRTTIHFWCKGVRSKETSHRSYFGTWLTATPTCMKDIGRHPWEILA